jgi:hypothetical protein
VKRENELIAADEHDYLCDQHLFPRPSKTSREVYFWDTYPANSLLQQDLKETREGSKMLRLPPELRMARTEYTKKS